MDSGLEIEGWYKDPFGHHELRWFSAGTATNLVRDGGAVSHDEPPSDSFDGPLVEADEVPVQDETARVGDDSGLGDEFGPEPPDEPVTMFGVP